VAENRESGSGSIGAASGRTAEPASRIVGRSVGAAGPGLPSRRSARLGGARWDWGARGTGFSRRLVKPARPIPRSARGCPDPRLLARSSASDAAPARPSPRPRSSRSPHSAGTYTIYRGSILPQPPGAAPGYPGPKLHPRPKPKPEAEPVPVAERESEGACRPLPCASYGGRYLTLTTVTLRTVTVRGATRESAGEGPARRAFCARGAARRPWVPWRRCAGREVAPVFL